MPAKVGAQTYLRNESRVKIATLFKKIKCCLSISVSYAIGTEYVLWL